MMKHVLTLALAAALAFPALAVDDDDKKQQQLEQQTGARIEALAKEIAGLAKACETGDPYCDLDKLAQDRFELKDQLVTAEELRAALAKKIAAETSAKKVDELSKRDVALLEKMEPARDVSFVAQEGFVSGDELVDEVKTLNIALTAAEEADDATNRKTLTTKLAHLERKLRKQGEEDQKGIAEIDSALKSGRLDLKYLELVAKRKHLTARLAAIEEIVTLPRSNPLYRVYDDDDDEWWIHNFYAGVEFDSVSGIFNNGFARIGYSNSLHVGGENIPESHPVSGVRNYGRYYEFNALLTSSAEQDIKPALGTGTSTDPCAPGTESTDPCLRKALEVEEKLFWPIYRAARHGGMRLYVGPVVAVGAKFVDQKPAADGAPLEAGTPDDSAHADYRYYFGIHSGFGRDLYSEFVYGRTRSLHTARLEVRGEVPVARWGTDSRLLLGWVANFRAGDRGKRPVGDPPERDVFRIYLTYDLDFLKLIGLKAPEAK